MSNKDHPGPSVPPTPATPTPERGSAGRGGDGLDVFCPWYINRWGRLMVASDYGYEAWHFRGGRKRKKKG